MPTKANKDKMQYNFCKKINDISSFSVLNMFFVYEDKKNRLYLNENIILDNSESYSFIGDKFCFYQNGKTHIMSLDNIEIVDTIISEYNYYPQNKVIIPFEEKQEDFIFSSKWSIYQIKPFKKLYELPHRHIGSGHIYNDYCVRPNKTNLSSLSSHRLIRMGAGFRLRSGWYFGYCRYKSNGGLYK